MVKKLKTKEEKTAEALEAAIAWLEDIRDDDRDGRGEFCYDEFAYKRRESELKKAAKNALKEIKSIMKEKK